MRTFEQLLLRRLSEAWVSVSSPLPRPNKDTAVFRCELNGMTVDYTISRVLFYEPLRKVDGIATEILRDMARIYLRELATHRALGAGGEPGTSDSSRGLS